MFVICSDGVRRSLDDALTRVLNYWGGQLASLGVVGYSPRPMLVRPGTRCVTRADARSANLELIQGLRWKQSFQFLKFDPAKGYSEPIDLTDSAVEMLISKPAYAVDVVLTPPASGEPIKLSLDLTGNQSEAWHALKTEAEREAFVTSLADELRDEIDRMLTEALWARSATDQNNRSDHRQGRLCGDRYVLRERSELVSVPGRPVDLVHLTFALLLIEVLYNAGNGIRQLFKLREQIL